jgi:Fe2+ transport system protein FeoA
VSTTDRKNVEPTAAEQQPFTPLQGEEREGAETFRCALCGTRFTHGVLACGSCPMSSACALVHCPACGYSFPRESRIVNFFKRLLGRRSRPEARGVQPLDRLGVGESARIVQLLTADPGRQVRLSGLGVVRGATVRLTQRRPATVFAVGETTVAVDRKIAREIWVDRGEGRMEP